MATTSSCTMDDEGDDKDDTKRRTRNLSEKKRRDQFNMLVNELSTMVSAGNRKMDKSTVLKSAICFLKNHNETTVRSRVHDIHEDWKPAFLSNEEFTYLLLEALEGFVIVFSCSGKIYYVSEGISSLMGHNPTDVVNKSIFDLTYENDRPNLYSLLHDPVADAMQGLVKEKEIRFQCHLKRGTLDFREDVTYELIQFNGRFRTNTEDKDNSDMQGPESRILFVGVGRLYTNLIRNVTLVDANQNEFTSRHSLEWKFLFLDHRAPPIIGYLPFEVLGTSGYDYYHFDDLEKVVACHESLMQKGELTSCYYRFLTKGQQWIWLQTRFYITYHQWNSKPEFIVCTHRVVSNADVAKSMERGDVEAGLVGENGPELGTVKEPPTDEAMAAASPAYMSEGNEPYSGSYQHVSRPSSVASVSASSTTGTAITIGTTATAGATYPHAAHARYQTGSDTASMSSESWCSQRNSSRELKFAVPTSHMYAARHETESTIVPQHGMGAQYLEPVPYVSVGMTGVAGVSGVLPLPLPHRPVLVTPDQAQMQEQLQRKHEQLQQMIVQQQEELRQVKEQLLLARLGIIQPLINVQTPYMGAEEMDQNQRLSTQVAFEGPAPLAIAGYPPQPPAHPTGHHQQMPQ